MTSVPATTSATSSAELIASGAAAADASPETSSSTTPSTSTTTIIAADLPEDVSKGLCEHIDEDHAVDVYGMAKVMLWKQGIRLRSNTKITNARMKGVSFQGATIQVNICQAPTSKNNMEDGGFCESHTLFYPFDPPLKQRAQLKGTFKRIHVAVCSPPSFAMAWRLTHPFLWILYPPLLLLILYGTFFVGIDKMTVVLESNRIMHMLVAQHAYSAEILASITSVIGIAIAVAHPLEASYAADYCRTKLKLPWSVAAQWAWRILIWGRFYHFAEFMDMRAFHEKHLPPPKKPKTKED